MEKSLILTYFWPKMAAIRGGGSGVVKNKIQLFRINEKKISHRLDPLVACFGSVEKVGFWPFLTENAWAGRGGGSENKFQPYIIKEKKNSHRLDALVA